MPKSPKKMPASVPEWRKRGLKIAPSKWWPLDEIKEYARNPRTHPPAQIELLGSLLEKYGPDQDIVVDERGEILKGHGRKLAARLKGWPSYPVVQRFGLSEAEKIAMRIEDNQLALLSGWDNELVRGEIAVLQKSGYELSLLGFGDAQLVSFTTTPGPPASFPEFGEDVPVQYCCPRCSYAWSGNPNAGAVKTGAEESSHEDSMRVRVPGDANGQRRARAPKKVSSKSSLARPTAPRKNQAGGHDDAKLRRRDGAKAEGRPE